MKYIIDPYNMEFEYSFKNTTFLNGIEVGTIDDVFCGSDNVRSDKFTVDGKYSKPLWYDSKAYFETKSNRSVEISLDTEARMDLAEEVTANAILRLVIKNTFSLDPEYEIFENNLIVMDKKDITYQDFDQLEILCNQLVRSNLPIEVKGNVATIPGLGSIDFDGPILKRTSEVSIIKLKMPSKTLSGIQIEILCGRKAYLDYKRKSKLIDNMMMTFRVDEENLFAKMKSIAIGKGYDFERRAEERAKKLEEMKQLEESKNLEDKPSESSDEEISNKDSKSSRKPKEKSKNEEKDKKSKLETANFLDDDFPEKPEEQSEEIEENSYENSKVHPEENLSDSTNKDEDEDKFSLPTEDHLEDKASPLPKGLNDILNFVTPIGDIRYVYKIQNKYSHDEIKEITKFLTDLPSYVVILGTLERDYSDLIVSRSKNLNVDLKEILDHIEADLKQSKGNMFQVETMCKPAELSNVMEEFLMEIKSKLGV
ncbi:hypothetical protein HMPREF9225_0913 [Peptoniphilus duerdenii ATCC BAA-1640]|uniref:Uncharacterized protein n=1 Tax=Peptoniphilus duerdenii ATCC BAA-1640 TaxID=862517 RepID=E0NL74_9FIRM|nr:hypothetical protein [Peptoniphilus duerdenii]EFM25449.1 hypothetical protein HMPREF9225_0913 [Peptoniphilus duerdenii ATCC BAA-1640]